VVDRTKLGAATLTRVVEWQVDYLPLALFPQTPPEVWQELAPQFSPTFWTDEAWRIALQTWVVEVDGLILLVDTGAGNGRDRAAMAPLDHLATDFLESLQRAGVSPESVDVVVNTHLHSDHVGWNTKRGNDSWVPTFPNARYLVPAADYNYFHPENMGTRRQARTEDEQARQDQGLIVWADSIAPIDDAGQVELWSEDHRISESLRLRSAPGHSPGSSVLWLDAGKPAVFVGDLTHSPVQIHRPGDSCAFDEDPATAAVTRRRVLTEASRRRAPVIPAHYPGHGGATVVARGDAFMIDDWLQISAL
jgi:glyoxylase-like metal-dependent hydrolase (beta-lactamase superfamily II)